MSVFKLNTFEAATGAHFSRKLSIQTECLLECQFMPVSNVVGCIEVFNDLNAIRAQMVLHFMNVYFQTFFRQRFNAKKFFKSHSLTLSKYSPYIKGFYYAN